MREPPMSEKKQDGSPPPEQDAPPPRRRIGPEDEDRGQQTGDRPSNRDD
jgi:hypothetical protein